MYFMHSLVFRLLLLLCYFILILCENFCIIMVLLFFYYLVLSFSRSKALVLLLHFYLIPTLNKVLLTYLLTYDIYFRIPLKKQQGDSFLSTVRRNGNLYLSLDVLDTYTIISSQNDTFSNFYVIYLFAMHH